MAQPAVRWAAVPRGDTRGSRRSPPAKPLAPPPPPVGCAPVGLPTAVSHHACGVGVCVCVPPSEHQPLTVRSSRWHSRGAPSASARAVKQHTANVSPTVSLMLPRANGLLSPCVLRDAVPKGARPSRQCGCASPHRIVRTGGVVLRRPRGASPPHSLCSGAVRAAASHAATGRYGRRHGEDGAVSFAPGSSLRVTASHSTRFASADSTD
jgi:hypothetical protein